MSTRLTVNGEERSVDDGTTVAQLLEVLGAGPRGIAVARNEDVVPRSRWSDAVIEPGDRVEILDAAQGG
ncbi:MAG: sulfur carrier protein ThiS [Actinomycetota bacterium]